MKHLHRTSLAAAAILSLLSGGVYAQTVNAEDAAKLDRLVKAAQAEKTIMSYGTTPLEQIGPTFKAFEQKYGLTVQSYVVTGTTLTSRFASEAAAKAMQADTLSTSDIGLQVSHPEYFQKLTDDNFPGYAQLPAAAKLAGDVSISYSVASFAVMWNTNKLSETARPHTWQDLVDPKWKGQSLLADPRSTLAYKAALGAAERLYPGFLAKVVANQPRSVEAGNPAAQQLAAGTGSFAYVGYEVQAAILREKGAPVNAAVIQAPELSRRVWLSAAAGPHPNAARLFVHFMASYDGLRAYCSVDKANKSIIDPSGKNTGCTPLAADVQFLPPDLISDKEAADVVTALHLE